MKRTKKLLALVLAMVMAFSLMAVTAAAYSAEEHEHVCSTEAIEPRRPAMKCENCGTKMDIQRIYEDEWGNRFADFKCPSCPNTVTGVPY